ncbi:hypothetical protein BC629DRAFT_1738081, partial [Irpex lacteus]
TRFYLVSAVAIGITAVSAIPRPSDRPLHPCCLSVTLPLAGVSTRLRLPTTRSSRHELYHQQHYHHWYRRCSGRLRPWAHPVLRTRTKARAVDVDDYFEQLASDSFVKRVGTTPRQCFPARPYHRSARQLDFVCQQHYPPDGHEHHHCQHHHYW